MDQKLKPDTSTARAAPASAKARSPGAGKEDWIANQLRRVYDDALHEEIPKEMLDLLNALDDVDTNGEREE